MREIFEQFLKAIEAKDAPVAFSLLTDDVELFDPHYPVQDMRGIEEVKEGLTWGLKSLKSMSFTIRHCSENSTSSLAFFEADCLHVLPNNKPIKFPQVFVVEYREQKIKAIRAYEPFGPHGFVGFMLKLNRFIWRLTHK